MKKILMLAIALTTLFGARADEGMWLPSLIGSRVKDMKSKGFKLKAEDIYSINKASLKDAVVLFGSGCTGELVSPEGLLFTNHHCGHSYIQSHSAVEHDYLTNGFWAMNRDEELPNPKLTVSFLVRMEDVTARLEAGETAEAIKAEASEGGKYKTSVESLFYGNQHFLFVYRVYTDVRLVAAPPSSIGKFGGDTDNWMWPRHTADFSVFRIYADKDNNPAPYSKDNVPYRPKRYFPISTKGVQEGDFTMIYGFPGNTQRYIISDAADFVLNRSNPMKIALRTIRLDIISAAQEADPAVRIQYAAKHASIANAWKKWQGESLGLERLGTIAKKQEYEKRFAAWAADKPQYASVLDSMHAAYAREADGYFIRECRAEAIDAVELNTPAVRLMSSKGKITPAVSAALDEFYKDYQPSIDLKIAARMYDEFLKRVPADKVPAEFKAEVEAHGGPEGYAQWLFDTSIFTSREKLEKALAESSDPAATVAQDPISRQHELFGKGIYDRKLRYRNLSNFPAIEKWYKPYLQGLMEFDTERAFFPDANLTLRVAYGKVGGYRYADGVYHKHYTTLDGIIDKDNPEIYDYDIPQSLRDLYASKSYGRWGMQLDGRTTVPVAFIASNHTTGGNSGSPIINGRGELVGINFDRTWLSTMSDIEFDPEICRNISVDIRFVLFTIDRIGGAGYLLDEMDLR